MNEKTKVYNVIIMDRSGSMWSIQKPAINGYNEVLGGVKAAARNYSDNQEQFFTLVLFDSTSIDEVYWNVPVEEAQILTEKTYVPGASTPLYDAVGRTLNKLEKELKDDDDCSVAVTIITDGYENASREYNLTSIRMMIDHLKKQGWTFAYMGTDHDVEGVTVNLSISNVIKFDKTGRDTLRSFKEESLSRGRWMKDLDMYQRSNPNATKEERIAFKTKLAEKYYKKDEEDKD
ncbi:MAG: VWA domain-containing protein [Bacteroidales bacterium]|nr:VWA domain-containing protein [Bacteroidales bacterium]